MDLLDPAEEEDFSRDPNRLRRSVLEDPKIEWIVIDEVQKALKLLDVVHFFLYFLKGKYRKNGLSKRTTSLGK